MSWLSDIFSLARPNTEAFRAITQELKEMKNEWKDTAQHQEKKIEIMIAQIKVLEGHEQECQRELIKIRKDYRDLKEEMIFIKKQK